MTLLVVAAIQFATEPCNARRNLTVVEGPVAEAEAVAQGAQWVCLPELSPGGYLLTAEIRKSAEPADRYSVSWLQSTARKHQAYIGMNYLEAASEHFYNTFILAGPDGTLHRPVHKNRPAAAEAAFFAPGHGPHVIESRLGRTGVLICYEALLHERLSELHAADVDIVLIPTSAGTPTPAFPIRKRDCNTFNLMLSGLAAHHAKALGVPVVMANKCGPLVTRMPRAIPAQDTCFPGLSTIADSNGCTCIQLEGQQGIAVHPVQLEKLRKRVTPPPAYRRWALPVPCCSFLFPLAGRLCAKDYGLSRERVTPAKNGQRRGLSLSSRRDLPCSGFPPNASVRQRNGR